jgi:TPM domain/Tetratricopeptide repeat
MRKNLLVLALILVAAAWYLLRSSDEQQHTTPTKSAPAGISASAPIVQHPRVQDEAAILRPFVGKLGRMADEFDRDLGIDVQVITGKADDGSIDAQAERLFRERKIGASAGTGGLLILLNPARQQARIEVSYSLEGGLPDLEVARIAREQLAPYAASGIAGMAVMDVLHYLKDLAALAAARDQIVLGEQYRSGTQVTEYRKFYAGGAGAKAQLTNTDDQADLKQLIPGPRRARYSPGTTIEESVDSFMRATAELAGDPSLELFTEGSRLLRASYPFARFEEQRRFETIERSRPLSIRRNELYAVVTSLKPAAGFVPILLRQDQPKDVAAAGAPLLWRVDLVETWKNLFFGSDGKYFLRNSNTRYAFGLAEFGNAQSYGIGRLPLDGKTLTDTISELERRNDVLSALHRGELWFRNAFVPLRAFAAYDEALKLAPQDPLVLETLAYRALYVELPELAIPALERMRARDHISMALAYRQLGQPERALEFIDQALKENPHDLQALWWKSSLNEELGRVEEMLKSEELSLAIESDPKKTGRPVWLNFSPNNPIFDSVTTLDVDGTRVFDHSEFGVSMTNGSGRPVIIERVDLSSEGNSARSGLGNIVGYWKFPSGGNVLQAGETVFFTKTWGFVTDTKHLHVRYVFRTCWREQGSAMKQCSTQHLDVLPSQLRL